MAKLWKGLFYCTFSSGTKLILGFWMSDKPLVQQRLATDLSSLLLSINPPSDKLSASLDYLGGFWEAMVREWEGLDRLRMDKFYLLIRRFVSATFQLLARESWNGTEIVGEILSKGPLK